MGAAVGEMLPLALGIAMSPMPIVAAILLVLSPNERWAALAYLAGWVAGIAITVTVFALLSSILPRRYPERAEPILGIIKIALGVALLVAAAFWFRSRPEAGTEPVMPGWMSVIDSMTWWRGLVFGFGFSIVNPKNLLLGFAAGAALGEATLPVGQDVAAVVLFTVVACSTVGIPIVAELVAPRAMAGTLQSLREWLLKNNATVMAVVLLVLGFVLIGKGIGTV